MPVNTTPQAVQCRGFVGDAVSLTGADGDWAIGGATSTVGATATLIEAGGGEATRGAAACSLPHFEQNFVPVITAPQAVQWRAFGGETGGFMGEASDWAIGDATGGIATLVDAVG